jgi:hypothetical protein
MEERRLQVAHEDVEAYFGRLDEALQDVPAHFVYNMDEMGHQEWADRPEKVCYVPTSHPQAHAYFPVPRTGKRITLVACVAANGSFLKPLIVVPRKTDDSDLALTGITDEKVAIYSQAKGYTDRPIYMAWLTEIFVPEVLRRREAFSYAGPVVLIIDNCTAHTGAEIDELCGEYGIRVCPLPPHSSNQMQPLDLSTFGVTKRLIARVNRMETVNVQSSHIAQVVSAFMSASSPLNVVGTFLSAGIALSLDAGADFSAVLPGSTRDACSLHLTPSRSRDRRKLKPKPKLTRLSSISSIASTSCPAGCQTRQSKRPPNSLVNVFFP